MSFLVEKHGQVPKLMMALKQCCILSSSTYFIDQAELQGQEDITIGTDETHPGLTTWFWAANLIVNNSKTGWASHLEEIANTWKGGG